MLARVNGARARREGPPAARARVAQRNAGPWIAKATPARAARALRRAVRAPARARARGGAARSAGSAAAGTVAAGRRPTKSGRSRAAQRRARRREPRAERVALEARQAAAHASAAGSNARAAARAAAATADAAEAAASRARARAAALSPDVRGSMYEMAVAGSDDGMVNFAQFLWLCLSIKKSCVLASSGVAVMPKKARVRDMLRLGATRRPRSRARRPAPSVSFAPEPRTSAVFSAGRPTAVAPVAPVVVEDIESARSVGAQKSRARARPDVDAALRAAASMVHHRGELRARARFIPERRSRMPARASARYAASQSAGA